jgi:hypothetical protein
MSVWGKLAGAAAGLAIGGPIGALLGGVAGHYVIDRDKEEDGSAENQVAFTVGVIALGAKMAKADGIVTADEVAAFRRIFVVEETGTIHIVNPDGTVVPEPFLDLSTTVSGRPGQQGMLGLAFHPDFANNGRFYVDYNNLYANGQITISEFQVDPDDPDKADPRTERPLLTIAKPRWRAAARLRARRPPKSCRIGRNVRSGLRRARENRGPSRYSGDAVVSRPGPSSPSTGIRARPRD